MASAAKKRSNTKKTNKSGNRLPKEVHIAIGIILAVFLELANFGVLGKVGGWLKYVQFGLFGAMGYIFPVLLLAIFLYIAFAKGSTKLTVVFCIVFFWLLCILTHLASGISLTKPIVQFFTDGADSSAGGGIIGGAVAAALYLAISRAGAYIVTIMLLLFSLFMIFRKQVIDFVNDLKDNSGYDEGRAVEKEPVSREKSTVRTRQKRREEPVYETEEEGTVIRIVKTPAKRRQVKRASLTRVRKKAAPMRDGSVSSERTIKKAKGVGTNTAIAETNAGGDEIHEITNARPRKEPVKETQPKAQPQPKTSVINVTEVITEPAAKQEQESVSKPEKKPRESLSGKTLSKGEPVRTFTPVTTVRGETGDDFELPPLSLLSRRKSGQDGDGNINQLARKLELVLETFGVNAKVIDTQVGPSVTRFELQPELGTRVSKITSLSDDLKLNLAVPEIRIEAPIPGRAAIGIEIPNKSRQTVTLRELLEAPEMQGHPSKIAFSAGKDISGHVIVSDMAKMPHLLVAGTTGSGKSVFLNSILMCILYRAKPSEVGLIIIDPKRVEFGVYAGIPHLMKGVVTDPGQAVSTLRWAVGEMTNRYQRMQLSGVRDFKTYNDKYDRGQLSTEEENPRRMQQIVIVIDELADLMMVAAKEVESLICRLAQLARAAGIHLIIATQRPSVDVVTGLIKANIPARAALLVASGVDSRTIIDMVGAEKLLGNGDMLFYPTGYVKPVRVQGAFVSDKEIQDTVKYLVRNKTTDYFTEEAEAMEQYMNGTAEGAQMSLDGTDASAESRYDEYFHEAGLLCIEQGKASSSMLQRRFNVGFNRAARIIDQLYEFGAVGPQNGAKPREILVDSMTFEEMWQQSQEQ